MNVSLVSPITLQKIKKKEGLSLGLNIYSSRRAAFRAAKRDNKVPMSEHPTEVIRPNTPAGDEIPLFADKNVKLYVFNLVVLGIAVEIREDKEAFYGSESGRGDQLPHFNSGKAKKKLKKHHYWKNGKNK